MQKEKKP